MKTKFVYDITQRDHNSYWLATKSGGFLLEHNQRQINLYLKEQLVRFVHHLDGDNKPYFFALRNVFKGKESLSPTIFKSKPQILNNSQFIGHENKLIYALDKKSNTLNQLAGVL